MNNIPTISIIVPVYNVENYVVSCLQSIASQTYRDFEAIIVDDGSPDRSADLCEEFCKGDTRFRLVHKKNGGLSSARNYGLDWAMGEYVIFIDSDDTVDPDMLKVFVSRFDSGVDALCCGVTRVYANGRREKQFTEGVDFPVSPHDALQSMLTLRGIHISAGSTLVRRNVLVENNIRFAVGEINEDFLYLVQLILASRTVAITGVPLYNYYERPDSITTSPMSTAQLVEISHIEEMKRLVLDRYPDLLPAVQTYEASILLNLARRASGRRFRSEHRAESDIARRALFDNKPLVRLIVQHSFHHFLLYFLIKLDLYRFLRG